MSCASRDAVHLKGLGEIDFEDESLVDYDEEDATAQPAAASNE